MNESTSQQPAGQALLGDRYRLGDRLGYGGMGRVYRAYDTRLGRDVAVKLVEAGPAAEDVELAIRKEAAAAARLSHSGIVPIFDAGTWQGRAFIVMELLDGTTLETILAKRGLLPAGEAIRVASNVAEALEHAHTRGVIHCDVKPANILITPDGRPKLIDFGIARAAGASGTIASGEIRGSAPYLSPEQVDGQRSDARSDVYALGAVLFEMLTGRPPFTAPTLTELLACRLVTEPPPPSSFNPALDWHLDETLLKALRRSPEDRYATAAAFRDELDFLAQYCGQQPTQTIRLPKAPVRAGDAERRTAAGQSRPRHRPARAVAAILLALLAGSAVVLAAQAAGQTRVPDLSGKRISQVSTALRQNRLVLGQVRATHAPEADQGKVLSQQPAAGQREAPGSSVDLVVGTR